MDAAKTCAAPGARHRWLDSGHVHRRNRIAAQFSPKAWVLRDAASEHPSVGRGYGATKEQHSYSRTKPFTKPTKTLQLSADDEISIYAPC
ncbi:hypothetical protein PEC311524_28150 [Pectobacterium carotovorum subsp. carotovorum]|nr:hypothetical protein PEC311524_28150 [Pectobacterium carotovorum subsp. carotovorum]